MATTWRDNRNYKLVLYNHGEKDPNKAKIEAFLPEQFDINVQNQWEPFMADQNEGMLGNINKGLSFFGTSLNAKLLSTLIWRRTEPLQLQFRLMFDAHTDAKKDVTIPTQRILSWANPRRKTALTVAPPGPTLGNLENRFSLHIGRLLYIDSVVITSAHVTYYTASEETGDFIAADVDLQLEAFYTPDANDIENFYGLGDAGDNAVKNIPNSQTFADAPQILKATAGDKAAAATVFGAEALAGIAKSGIGALVGYFLGRLGAKP